MQEDTCVLLRMVVWLKCCKVTTHVGEHGLDVGTEEELSNYTSLSELFGCRFGTGYNSRDIPIHTIYSDIGPSKSLELPLFHSPTVAWIHAR